MKLTPLEAELAWVLAAAQDSLREHDREYNHHTPKPLFEKIAAAMAKVKATAEKRERDQEGEVPEP